MESAPRAYRLKASNAAPPISTFPGAIPRDPLQLPYKERALYDGSGTTMTMNQSRSAALSRKRAGRSPPAEGPSKNRQSMRMNYERYLALARAQTLAGDQVEAENSYQHAEHYFRSMSESAR